MDDTLDVFGPGTVTSSIIRAGPHGGRYEFSNIRLDDNGLLRPAHASLATSEWLSGRSRRRITCSAGGIGVSPLGSSRATSSGPNWSPDPISEEPGMTIACISEPPSMGSRLNLLARLASLSASSYRFRFLVA